jgi:hypothetical protein
MKLLRCKNCHCFIDPNAWGAAEDWQCLFCNRRICDKCYVNHTQKTHPELLVYHPESLEALLGPKLFKELTGENLQNQKQDDGTVSVRSEISLEGVSTGTGVDVEGSAEVCAEPSEVDRST